MHRGRNFMAVMSRSSSKRRSLMSLPVSVLMFFLLLSSARAQETLSGREYYKQLIDNYGVASTTRWLESVARVAGRLADVSEPLNDRYVVTVLNAPETYNAIALDGGYVVLFSGFLDAFDVLIGEQGTRVGTEEYSEYLDNLVAPIVAHEIAHLLLDHYSQLKQAAPKASENDVERFLREREMSREAEYEADRLGALLMARARYPLAAMYFLFETFDALEDNRFEVENLTYLRSHPRPTDREANLDIWKGELKKNQARIDDAVALIQNNVALDVALALLDTALTYFPQLVSLRHNRATAWHRVWLNTLTVSDETPASSFALYAPDVMELLRSEVDEEAYRQAVADYLYVIDRYNAPRTVSQLASLVASSGNTEAAFHLTDRALSDAPNDPVVLANLSAVQLYARQYDAAYTSAKNAAELLRNSNDSSDYVALAPTIYNLGLSAKALGRAEESERAFHAYMQLDSTSRHARIAGLQLGTTVEPRNRNLRLIEAGEPIDGLRFGATGFEITSSIGTPEFVDDLGLTEILGYPSEGLSVHLIDGECAVILARGPFQRAMHGVRLGAPRSEVTEKLGHPASVSASGWLEYPELEFSVRIQNDMAVAFMARG